MSTAKDIIAQTQSLWQITADGDAGPQTDAAYAAIKAAAAAGLNWPVPTVPAPATAPQTPAQGHPWSACLAEVSGRGVPPVSFLDELFSAIVVMPDADFMPDPENDIYAALKSVLGDPPDFPTRRGIMFEALRVLAGEESSWNWNCGVDMEPGAGTGRPQSAWETGAFQTSQNSLALDPSGSLAAFLDASWGAHDPATFIARMKTDHTICVQFTAKLLRFSYSWDGPILSGAVAKNVKWDCVSEFLSFLPK